MAIIIIARRAARCSRWPVLRRPPLRVIIILHLNRQYFIGAVRAARARTTSGARGDSLVLVAFLTNFRSAPQETCARARAHCEPINMVIRRGLAAAAATAAAAIYCKLPSGDSTAIQFESRPRDALRERCLVVGQLYVPNVKLPDEARATLYCGPLFPSGGRRRRRRRNMERPACAGGAVATA